MSGPKSGLWGCLHGFRSNGVYKPTGRTHNIDQNQNPTFTQTMNSLIGCTIANATLVFLVIFANCGTLKISIRVAKMTKSLCKNYKLETKERPIKPWKQSGSITSTSSGIRKIFLDSDRPTCRSPIDIDFISFLGCRRNVTYVVLKGVSLYCKIRRCFVALDLL